MIQLGVGPKSTSSLIRSDSSFQVDKITTNGLNIGTTASIGSVLTVGGDLVVNGTLNYLNTENTIIKDPLIKQGDNNPSDIVDIGNFGVYNDGTTKYTGIFRWYFEAMEKLL